MARTGPPAPGGPVRGKVCLTQQSTPCRCGSQSIGLVLLPDLRQRHLAASSRQPSPFRRRIWRSGQSGQSLRSCIVGSFIPRRLQRWGAFWNASDHRSSPRWQRAVVGTYTCSNEATHVWHAARQAQDLAIRNGNLLAECLSRLEQRLHNGGEHRLPISQRVRPRRKRVTSPTFLRDLGTALLDEPPKVSRSDSNPVLPALPSASGDPRNDGSR
jgi:hypothetical protein